MKNIIVLYFLLSICVSTNAQGVISPNWIKLDSSSNNQSEAWGVDVDDNDNIYWAISNNDLNQGLDVYCYKFKFGGQALWSSPFSFGGAGTQHAYVCNAQTNAIYIGGRSCSALINTCDMMLLKVDKNTGNLVWDRTKNFTANGYDEIDGLEIIKDKIYCGGWSQELNSSIYRSDIGLWKLDTNGNTEWTNYLGSNTTAEHQDGHFVVDNNGIYAAGLWGGKGIANLYNGHAFLGKFDLSNGNLIDSTLFGHQSPNFNDIENALGMTSDGNHLYITGYTTPISANDWQIFVAKFDKELNQIWYTDWGGSGTESARGIAIEGDKVYVAGLSESSTIMTGGNRDAVLLILDTNGNVSSYQTYGGKDKESFQDLAVRNKNIYLTGTIENSSGSKKSVLLAIEDTTTSLSENIHSIVNTHLIYPNPSKGLLKIKFLKNEHEKGNIKVFNQSGRLITETLVNKTDQELLIQLNEPGINLIQISFPSYTINRKILNQ